MATGREMGQWIRSNPNQIFGMAVAVVVIGVAGWVGTQARAASASLATKRAAWEQTANQLATVRQQFRVPSSTESAALIVESSRMGALGVPASEKLTLVESIGRLAEACALRQVRANAVAKWDSAYVVERQMGATSLQPADYAVAVEFAGGFADALKFVNSLPLSVSLSRMTAGRRGEATVYQLILSVYQLDGNPGA